MFKPGSDNILYISDILTIFFSKDHDCPLLYLKDVDVKADDRRVIDSLKTCKMEIDGHTNVPRYIKLRRRQ